MLRVPLLTCVLFTARPSKFNKRRRRKPVPVEVDFRSSQDCRQQWPEAAQDHFQHCQLIIGWTYPWYWCRIRWHVALLHRRLARNQSVSDEKVTTWKFQLSDPFHLPFSGPVPVLVMSLLFIASVFMLHIWGKYTRS